MRDPVSRGEPLSPSPIVPFPRQEHMTAGGNCQTFSSSTVISYSNTGDGAPKVYQETSEMRSAPGGVSWRASPLPEKTGLNSSHKNPGCFFQDWVVGGLSLLGWCCQALKGAAECSIFCLILDPGDSEDCTRLGQWTRADVHWASHPRPGSHPSALPKPPHRGPGGAAGLHQPG